MCGLVSSFRGHSGLTKRPELPPRLLPSQPLVAGAGPGAGSRKPGRAVLDADSYTCGVRKFDSRFQVHVARRTPRLGAPQVPSLRSKRDRSLDTIQGAADRSAVAGARNDYALWLWPSNSVKGANIRVAAHAAAR